jgi:hypothetical protein
VENPPKTDKFLCKRPVTNPTWSLHGFCICESTDHKTKCLRSIFMGEYRLAGGSNQQSLDYKSGQQIKGPLRLIIYDKLPARKSVIIKRCKFSVFHQKSQCFIYCHGISTNCTLVSCFHIFLA